jgi:hypothetical protein
MADELGIKQKQNVTKLSNIVNEFSIKLENKQK